MKFLEYLTKDLIEKGVPDILENSCYYPSCRFDGGIIRHYSKYIQSFVYCDYSIGEDEFIKEMDRFYGYNIIGHRTVSREELIPHGWNMVLPPDFDIDRYFRYQHVYKKPFTHWVVYERRNQFEDNHGPKRFSLLYIGGEGVATYQALYWSNKIKPKALVIIRPGTCFGLNWTNFYSNTGPLNWVVMNNPFGTPELIFCDKSGKGYNNLGWKGYSQVDTISPYYIYRDASYREPSGTVTIWERTCHS